MINPAKTIELMFIRRELSSYVDEADLDILIRMERSITGRERDHHKVYEDMGSEVIEKLLDEIETADYETLKSIYTILKEEKLIK